GRRRALGLRRRSPAASATRRARLPACSRRRPGRSGAARTRTTRPSPPAPRPRRCRRRAARRRRRARSADGLRLQRRAAARPRPLSPGDELRNVELHRRARRPALAHAAHTRLTDGFTHPLDAVALLSPLAGVAAAMAAVVVARGHDRHPHLVVELL